MQKDKFIFYYSVICLSKQCNKHAFCSTCLESRPNVRSSIHLLRSTAQLTAFPFAPSSTLTHTFIFPRSSCLLSFSLVTNLQLITFQVCSSLNPTEIRVSTSYLIVLCAIVETSVFNRSYGSSEF